MLANNETVMKEMERRGKSGGPTRRLRTQPTIQSTRLPVEFGSQTRIKSLAAYAPGKAYRLNAYNLGSIPHPSITLTDADGNTNPASILSTQCHSLDILLPASAGLGRLSDFEIRKHHVFSCFAGLGNVQTSFTE
jgi:hypothetical protein